MYFDRQGKKIDRAQFSGLMRDPAYSTVKRSELLPGYTLSTIWVGFVFGKDGGVFETSILNDKGKIISTYPSSTEEGALKVHQEKLDRWHPPDHKG